MSGFRKFGSGALTALAGVLMLGSMSTASFARPAENEESRRPVWSRGEEQRASPDRGAQQGRNWQDRRGDSQSAQSTRTQSPRWQRGDEQRDRANDGRTRQSARTVGTASNDPIVRQHGDRHDATRTRDNWRERDNWRSDRQTRHDRDSWRQDRRDGSRWSGDTRRWDRDWRRDNRYDWRSYRNSHRHYYRLGRYHSPYNHHRYSRPNIGFTLNSLFFGQNYWVSDPWRYRLPDVYGPYRWVRYYDDVLLVNVYSGQVMDVIHDFFW